ncbi:MAG: hypothetical protein JRG79_01680 [Deltaproteobacteria bacterium]|nr:hypothetical protein [Deltaproteobacteria bacterium]MBW1941635.1 hypothetical protein [Deltaproteobacteria bacterium]MBW2205592.1 hypothetical protein [Deltaproteobacteria bacterium]
MPEETVDSSSYADETGNFFLLNKTERKLLKEILNITLSAEQGKKYIIKKLGEEYLEVGEDFLKKIGG